MGTRVLKCAACSNEIPVEEQDQSKIYRCRRCSGILMVPGVTTRRRVPAGTRFGRFQLINMLARGAHSVVYRALDTEKLRLVALKQRTGPETADAAALMEWAERTRSIVTLEHASLVQTYEVGLEEGTGFVTMALIEGLPLQTVTQTVGMALFPLLTALRDVARGVQYLHERGYIHGRVVGENVLLNDHSIASLVSLDSMTTIGPSSTDTDAPHALRAAEGKDAAVDLRALGRLLYESVVRQSADGAIPPHELGVELQRDLAYLVVKAARCDYPSAGDLAADIELYLNGKPLVKDKDPLWKRLLGG